MNNDDSRFDALLKAMTGHSAQSPSSTRQASRVVLDDDCSDIQTRPDTSPDALQKRGLLSPVNAAL